MSAPASLERRLGAVDAAAIVISNVIGGGIFFVPILVARLVPDPNGILLVWLAGGAFALAGAMAYAELAAVRPKAGGEYVYLREAFGPLAGFLSGWTSFVAGFSGAIAASAIALAEYLGRFVPVAGDGTILATLALPFVPLIVTPKSLVALAVIGLLTLVHFRGLGPGRLVQNTLAAAKTLALVAFVAVGFSIGDGNASAWENAGAVHPTGFLLALVPVMFAYSGWNAASYVAEEVRNPERNVPLSLGVGTAIVVAIYLALNALYVWALSTAGLSAVSGTLIDSVAERLFGGAMGRITAAFTIVSIAASISAMILAGPRVYFAMARDGLFVGPAARVHPRFHAPTSAILAQAAWSAVLVLCGSLAQLVSYTGFALILFSSAAVGSIFVLRRRQGHRPLPFKAWGYPWAPIAFVTAGVLVAGNEMWRNPKPAFAGLAIIAAGVPVYGWLSRRKRAVTPTEVSSGPPNT